MTETNLAEVLWVGKQFDAAEALYGKAVTALEKIWGADSPKLLPCLERYASMLHATRHYGPAEQTEVKAMRIRVKQALAQPNSRKGIS